MKYSTDNETIAHPEFIQIELPILATCALAICQDATAWHHGGTTAHVCHGCRKLQRCRVVCCDTHLNATRPFVYQAINSNLPLDRTGKSCWLLLNMLSTRKLVMWVCGLSLSLPVRQILLCLSELDLHIHIKDGTSIQKIWFSIHSTSLLWHSLEIPGYPAGLCSTYNDQHSAHTTSC
jgi:hypothetical protein